MARKVILILLMMEGIVAVLEDCEHLPEIRNSVNNLSGIYLFPEHTSIQFGCLPEYRPEGNDIYKCLDGEWVGGPFSCIIKECPLIGSPKHGERIGDSYKIGDVMRFKCDNGYELIGSNTSLCQTNSKWHPISIPECRIKKCPAVPAIEHGDAGFENTVNGNGVYGSKLRVHCDTGFMINGPVIVHCDANGQWTEIPKCKHVTCPPYPGLDAQCVRRSKLELNNTLLSIRCTEHSTFFAQGDGIALCDNNKWDDISMRCYCDCKVNANLDFVDIENLDSNGFLKHNVSLIWSCKNESTKSTDEPLVCNDGFIKTPVCAAHLDPKKSSKETPEANITMIVVTCVLIGVIIVVILGIFIYKNRKEKLVVCFAKTSRNHQSQCDTEQRISDEEKPSNHGKDLSTEKADTVSPKSYTTTVNIETRGKQGNETSGHPVNKEIKFKIPYAGDLPEAKENVAEESVFGNSLEATKPSTVLIAGKETKNLNEQRQFSELTETAHQEKTQLHPSSDQKVQDKLPDMYNGMAQEDSFLTDITSTVAKDTATAAQSNRSMQNTEEPMTQKDPNGTTPDKKHICGKCGEYVPLSQEDSIGNQVYHNECVKSLYKSSNRDKENI